MFVYRVISSMKIFFSPPRVWGTIPGAIRAVAKQADARKRNMRIATMPWQGRKHAAKGPNPFDF